ncbi:MAG: site-2 protease family protein, partial [Thermomicrobiales bacterium]
MPLGGFGLISLFYAFLGVRFAVQFWPQRKAVFDRRVTDRDRTLITQAAFFFLLPFSVALHELGHAVAIWLFGGEVVDFGFYFFAGFVSYDPTGFSDTQQMLIAFAGTLVNILLIVLAMGLIMLKNPPLPAAWNEFLLQFTAISGLNALIFYPLLDLATGMSGDWSQMYDGGVPWLTAVIITVQIGLLALGMLLVRNPKTRARLAERTAVANPEDRGFFNWGAGARTKQAIPAAQQLSADEQRMNSAAARVSSGWPDQVAGKFSRTASGTALIL